jgi:hypothetical protein
MTLRVRAMAGVVGLLAGVTGALPLTADAQVHVGARIGGRGGHAGLRLEVKPSETEVFVNGAYAGRVDDFDNIFQQLNARGGAHEITLYLPGHRPFVQNIFFQPGKTLVVHHTMQRLERGELEPERPDRAPPGRRGRAAGRGRAAAPARARTGSVSLRVEPDGATVTIDGDEIGIADGEEPFEVVGLDPGRHIIAVHKAGYRRLTTEVSLRPGETAPLNIKLTPR